MAGTYWKAERPDQAVRLQGPIALTGAQQANIDAVIDRDGAFRGTIGAVNVITGPTLPPPPAPPSAAQLLAGGWTGRAVTKVIGPGIRCDFTEDLTLTLAANGANSLTGNLVSRVVRGGCTGIPTPAFPGAQGAVNATARDGRIDFGSGWTGEYNASGTWMGGDCGSNPAIGWSCQWQAGR